MKQQSVHSFIGLQQDLDPLKHPANLLDDAQNIRITAREDGTLLSITNEVGPKVVTLTDSAKIYGRYLGHCVLNKYLVVFTTDIRIQHTLSSDEEHKTDYIYRIDLDTKDLVILYSGNLKFNCSYPIEAFGDYETDLIQKVYWTDGYNQPRMINILDVRDPEGSHPYDDYSFDFVQPLALNEIVTVTKEFSANGMFAPGTIQYAFTYYNLYGSETNIFYTTPIFYTSFIDRGGSPEDKVENAFRINIQNADTRFDFVRIYSIQRTSINGTPVVKRLQDIGIQSFIHSVNNTYNYLEADYLYNGYPNFYFTYDGIDYWRDYTSMRKADPYRVTGDVHTPNNNGGEVIIKDYYYFSLKQYPNLKIRVNGHEYSVLNNIYVCNVHIEVQGEPYNKIIVSPVAYYHMEYTDASQVHWTEDYYINLNNLPKDSIQDVESTETVLQTITYVDDGKNGDIVDPQSLYYKGGESILAETMTTKDNTLFLGNIFINRPIINNVNIGEIQQYTMVSCSKKNVYPHKVSGNPYPYWNFLTTYIDAEGSELTNAAGFKRNEIYRLGVQFQHYTGKWSQPIWIENNSNETIDGQTLKDWKQIEAPSQDSSNPDLFEIPIFQAQFSNDSAQRALQQIKEQGYVKARPVVVFPNINDRRVVMQGITTPTVYRESDRHGIAALARGDIESVSQMQNLYRLDSSAHGSIHAQSSWFFRPYCGNTVTWSSQEIVYNIGGDRINVKFQTNQINRDKGSTTISALDDTYLPQFPIKWTFDNNVRPYPDLVTPNTPDIQRGCEIQGLYSFYNAFKVDSKFVTFHSPDIIFDDNTWSLDYSNCKIANVGKCWFKRTSGDIDITLKTGPLVSDGGFIHKSTCVENDDKHPNQCLCGGWFYQDFIADDYDKEDALPVKPYPEELVPINWFVYPWQKSGSLNNDFTWGSHQRSAELQTKVLSNLKYADTFFNSSPINMDHDGMVHNGIPQLVKDDFIHAVKTDNKIYFPNIDKVLTPDYKIGYIISSDSRSFSEIINNGTGAINQKMIYPTANGSHIAERIPDAFTTSWMWLTRRWNDDGTQDTSAPDYIWPYPPVGSNTIADFASVMVRRNVGKYNKSYTSNRESVLMRYRSTPHMVISLEDKLEAGNLNVGCLPLCEIVKDYNNMTKFGGYRNDALQSNVWLPAGEPVSIDYLLEGNTLDFIYGDTWYQRFDCLKTYSYSNDDPNQIIEIGSFMAETRMNIDGRYDRNRGLVSNIYIGPTNFNLYNPVYSQLNNYFTYKIIDERFTQSDRFTNQITWSLEKHPASEIDVWTQTTLASTHNLNGTSGEIRYLNTWNGNIFCFQDTGISNILFNSRVQIPVSDGVPVEITNGYKVDGERYISDTMGSINKYTITPTPKGIYFIDTNSKILNIIGSQGIQPVSTAKNMQIWFNGLTPEKWTASNYTTKSFYDSYNEDLYICNSSKALCFSERLDQFTSFMSYGNADAIFNANKNIYALNSESSLRLHTTDTTLYEMFKGIPNRYFQSEYYPYYITFISNGLSDQQNLTLNDKTFTNIHIQSDKWNDQYDTLETEAVGSEDQTIINKRPFDFIRVQDEYQDTRIYNQFDYSDIELTRSICKPDTLKSKFRLWNIVIPRDGKRKLDRIRNPWCKITLSSGNRPIIIGQTNPYDDGCRITLHNIIVDFLTC